jgi:tetratricopeptide (TPR) repeat protein
MGVHEEALAAGRRALTIAADVGDEVLEALAGQSLGEVYWAHGDYAQAVECFERANALVVSELQIEAHLWVEAQQEAERALGLAREHALRPCHAQALWLLGTIAARRDAAAGAESLYREALALAAALGMRPLVAHCHLGLSTVYRRTNRREQAQEHLTTATTMYRAMGMTYWLEKAEAEMRELG